MREELIQYYERELTYLRQMGGDFARRYPRVAGRLLLGADSCEDPHVERLLEGFALMAAFLDAGQGARHSVGTAVAGGMLASTFLNLAFIPVLYVVVKSLTERNKNA